MHMIPNPGSKSLTICFAVLVSFVGSSRISAATLADYRHRVSQAITLGEQLQATHANEELSRPEQFVSANVARIREMLPAQETVLLNGQNVMVDNAWLHEALQKYEETSIQARRVEALARIVERLRALDERLNEMQRGKSENKIDKEADKGRLAEILRRPDYNREPAAEGSALERLWARFLRWLLSLLPKTGPIIPNGSPFLARLAQIIVVGGCLGVIAFLVWKLAPRYLSGRSRKKQKREARIVLGERLEPDQTAADLLAQAESLARDGDLRGAIRKAYIALLCELGDRKIVSLAQHKTNRDYLHSVRERVHLYSSMRQLTNSFELHWYGFQPPAENDWTEFQNGYQKALRLGSGS